MNKTIFVNLFAGPGCGKSTHAAGVFSKLKQKSINCEYLQEYAKDKSWGEDVFTLKCQPYITSKQLYRQYRIMDKVDVAVTDSPLLLGLVYDGFGSSDLFNKWVVETFGLFTNLNIRLVRNASNHPYKKVGRSQTEEESIVLDNQVKIILDSFGIVYHDIEVSENSIDQIVDLILLTIQG